MGEEVHQLLVLILSLRAGEPGMTANHPTGKAT
jgi:hypothetical protein